MALYQDSPVVEPELAAEKDTEIEQVPEQETNLEEKKRAHCPSCASTLEPDALFCTNCGLKLNS